MHILITMNIHAKFANLGILYSKHDFLSDFWVLISTYTIANVLTYLSFGLQGSLFYVINVTVSKLLICFFSFENFSLDLFKIIAWGY